jgi:hypothetical protein
MCSSEQVQVRNANPKLGATVSLASLPFFRFRSLQDSVEGKEDADMADDL